MVFGRLTILNGLGTEDNRLGIWISPELGSVSVLVAALGRLTIRRGVGMSTSSSQSDQNSMSSDSDDSDAISS
jgi:hypothetical protein